MKKQSREISNTSAVIPKKIHKTVISLSPSLQFPILYHPKENFGKADIGIILAISSTIVYNLPVRSVNE